MPRSKLILLCAVSSPLARLIASVCLALWSAKPLVSCGAGLFGLSSIFDLSTFLIATLPEKQKPLEDEGLFAIDYEVKTLSLMRQED